MTAVFDVGEQDFMERVVERSREIHLDEWRKRPIHKKIFERAAKALIEQY